MNDAKLSFRVKAATVAIKSAVKYRDWASEETTGVRERRPAYSRACAQRYRRWMRESAMDYRRWIQSLRSSEAD